MPTCPTSTKMIIIHDYDISYTFRVKQNSNVQAYCTHKVQENSS